jgi:hypothetical protein
MRGYRRPQSFYIRLSLQEREFERQAQEVHDLERLGRRKENRTDGCTPDPARTKKLA